MFLLPVRTLLSLDELPPHEELRDKDLLVPWTSELQGRVIFVSHQWQGSPEDGPDPDGEHFATLRRLLDRLSQGCETAGPLPYGRKAAQWKDALPFMGVWVDFASIPQDDERTKQRAIASIPCYVARSTVFLVLAPPCEHPETGQCCSLATWRGRGWCRAELAAAHLAPDGPIPVLLCTGPEATPSFCAVPTSRASGSTFAGLSDLLLPPGDGDFGCCERGHVGRNGRKVACDRPRVRSVLQALLDARDKSALAVHQNERRTSVSLQRHFLRSLSPRDRRDGSDTATRHTTRWESLQDLEKRLGCDEGFSMVGRYALLPHAAMMGDVHIVSQLLASGHYDLDLELGYLLDDSRFGPAAGMSPLMLAMCYGDVTLVDKLIAVRAHPEERTSDAARPGMDALMWAATSHTQEANVRHWLSRFPDWDLRRTESSLDRSVLAIAVAIGTRKAGIVSALLEARADSRQADKSGALPLHIAAAKDDLDPETLQLLIEAAPDTLNYHIVAPSGHLSMTARLAARFGRAEPELQELDAWDSMTPLHAAAAHGHLEILRFLVNARADPGLRTARGQTPLDLAKDYLGVRDTAPPTLVTALSGGDLTPTGHAPLPVAAEGVQAQGAVSDDGITLRGQAPLPVAVEGVPAQDVISDDGTTLRGNSPLPVAVEGIPTQGALSNDSATLRRSSNTTGWPAPMRSSPEPPPEPPEIMYLLWEQQVLNQSLKKGRGVEASAEYNDLAEVGAKDGQGKLSFKFSPDEDPSLTIRCETLQTLSRTIEGDVCISPGNSTLLLQTPPASPNGAESEEGQLSEMRTFSKEPPKQLFSCTLGPLGVTALRAVDETSLAMQQTLWGTTWNMTMSATNAVRGQHRTWVRGDFLGQGSLGTVSSALDQTTGEMIAVKEVNIATTDQSDLKFAQALEYELGILKDLRHPHIVAYLGHDYLDSCLYIYLEYMPGGSLATVLSQFGPLEESLLAVYARQLLEGLEYLHGRSSPVLHRDIKGANVLVGLDCKVKLSDFGCSKRIPMNLAHTMVGSIPWMAPEVIQHKPYGPEADIWSFGCLIIEMATGKRPWGRFDNPMAACNKIARSEELPPVPASLTSSCQHFISCCLQREALLRHSACQLLQHELVRDLVEGTMDRRDVDEYLATDPDYGTLKSLLPGMLD